MALSVLTFLKQNANEKPQCGQWYPQLLCFWMLVSGGRVLATKQVSATWQTPSRFLKKKSYCFLGSLKRQLSVQCGTQMNYEVRSPHLPSVQLVSSSQSSSLPHCCLTYLPNQYKHTPEVPKHITLKGWYFKRSPDAFCHIAESGARTNCCVLYT